MKIVIAGSRGFMDYFYLDKVMTKIAKRHKITEVISGTASGADKLGELWAENNKMKLKRMPADWDTHGKAAGYIRNEEMCNATDVVLVMWDGISRGSKYMYELGIGSGKPTYLYNTRTKQGSKFNEDTKS